jgi:hypothetical protein
MDIEADLAKRLNLLRSSPTFILKDLGSNGKQHVVTTKLIPENSGSYWVAGRTTLKNGRVVEAVFNVDTGSGGSLLAIFWFIGKEWYRHDDHRACEALNLSREEIFPFDWDLAVPLEKDIFH